MYLLVIYYRVHNNNITYIPTTLVYCFIGIKKKRNSDWSFNWFAIDYINLLRIVINLNYETLLSDI